MVQYTGMMKTLQTRTQKVERFLVAWIKAMVTHRLDFAVEQTVPKKNLSSCLLNSRFSSWLTDQMNVKWSNGRLRHRNGSTMIQRTKTIRIKQSEHFLSMLEKRILEFITAIIVVSTSENSRLSDISTSEILSGGGGGSMRFEFPGMSN